MTRERRYNCAACGHPQASHRRDGCRVIVDSGPLVIGLDVPYPLAAWCDCDGYTQPQEVQG